MITELTEDQIKKFPYYIKKWTDIGLCTDPANRELAEKNINQCYILVGLKEPEKIIWCGSPLSMILTRIILLNFNKLIDKKNIDSIISDSLASVRDSVWNSVWNSVRDSVVESVWQSIWHSVRESVWQSGYGQHDANWLGFYDFFRKEINLEEQTNKIIGLMEFSKNAGWFLPCEKICFVSERHNILNRDDQGRIHSINGSAIEYPDGWKIYAIHGVRIPEYIIKNPEKITVEEIESQSNIEVRRVMREKYGNERYLQDSGAILIYKDKFGELYKKKIKDDTEPFCMIKVINSTPEPDGTFKVCFRQVPPFCKTAHEAVAWTFGKTVETYNPLIET